MNLSALADLLDAHGLRLLPGSFAVPVNLLVVLPDSSVAHFTARGTTLRLAIHEPQALTSVVVAPDCGCGKHHAPSGPSRMTLRSDAVPVVERTIDGELAFGWTGHEAGLLRLTDAAAYFFELLAEVTTRELVGVT
jgi:hypothetical protein